MSGGTFIQSSLYGLQARFHALRCEWALKVEIADTLTTITVSDPKLRGLKPGKGV